jgi:hypothetical protein
MVDLARFRVPAGSLVVDASLVLALLWGAATMTEQLKAINLRIDSLESAAIRSNSDARILVLERRADEMAEFKGEIRAQLARIEDKLDRIAGTP